MLAWEAINRDVSVPELLLVNNLLHRPSITPFWTWFVQVLIQDVLIYCALFLVPRYRATFRRDPFLATLWPLGIGIVATALQTYLIGPSWSTVWSFWLFPLGIAISSAGAIWRKALLTAIIVAVSVSTYDTNGRIAYFILAMGALIWFETIPVPAILRRPIGAIASASLFIYMLHHAVPAGLSLTRSWQVDVMRTAIAALVGIIAWRLYQWVVQSVSARLTTTPQPAPQNQPAAPARGSRSARPAHRARGR